MQFILNSSSSFRARSDCPFVAPPFPLLTNFRSGAKFEREKRMKIPWWVVSLAYVALVAASSSQDPHLSSARVVFQVHSFVAAQWHLFICVSEINLVLYYELLWHMNFFETGISFLDKLWRHWVWILSFCGSSNCRSYFQACSTWMLQHQSLLSGTLQSFLKMSLMDTKIMSGDWEGLDGIGQHEILTRSEIKLHFVLSRVLTKHQ